MCDTDNLIDLTLEEEMQLEQVQLIPSLLPSEAQQVRVAEVSGGCGGLLSFISPQTAERVSLDNNNPFDQVQKLANNHDDPFERLESEACLKALPATIPAKVQLAKLLSLEEDEQHSLSCRSLEEESPPITMSNADPPPLSRADAESTSDGSGGDGGSASLSGGHAHCRTKPLESRKRLLKLSLSNSACSSPLSRYGSTSSINQIGDEATQRADESSLQLVDDDLMAETPPNFIDSAKDFEADLEMLKIPMLKESPTASRPHSTCASPLASSETQANTVAPTPEPDCGLHDLEQLRLKLQAKRKEAGSTSAVMDDTSSSCSAAGGGGGSAAGRDVSGLIQSLKALICDDMADNAKKLQASSLLENLSCAWGGGGGDGGDDRPATPPQPIVREATFDRELEEQRAFAGERRDSGGGLHGNVPFDCLPEAMLASSATYDGEPRDEQEQLPLPEVDPHYAQARTPPPPAMQSDVSELVEQLSRLLEQHQQQAQAHAQMSGLLAGDGEEGHNGAAGQECGGASLQAPTFIVVMPPSSPYAAAASAEYDHTSAMRRRSQSLSLHDKVKILQLPQPTPTKGAPPMTPVAPTAAEYEEAHEFKTPARSMARRNSFSSSLPYTPAAPVYGVAARRSHVHGADTNAKQLQPLPLSRRPVGLETHMEGRQQAAAAVIRPMALSQSHMSAFKADLKKRPKTNCSADSILKSAAPMKATIPVKKVAPMLKVSPSRSHHHQQQNDGTMPIPSKMGGRVSIGAGLPSACSTPTVQGTPMKRSNLGSSRYSTTSALPSTRPQAPVQHGTTAATRTSAPKRRTIAEFKAKSPLKTRSSIGGAMAGSLGARGGARVNSKVLSGMARPTTGGRGTTTVPTSSGNRSMMQRSHAGATPTTTYRNKENKLP